MISSEPLIRASSIQKHERGAERTRGRLTLIAQLRWTKKRLLLSWYHRQRRVNPFRAIGRAARATNDNGGRQQWWKKENMAEKTRRGRARRKMNGQGRRREERRRQAKQRKKGWKRDGDPGRGLDPAKKNRRWVSRVTRRTSRGYATEFRPEDSPRIRCLSHPIGPMCLWQIWVRLE